MDLNKPVLGPESCGAWPRPQGGLLHGVLCTFRGCGDATGHPASLTMGFPWADANTDVAVMGQGSHWQV